MYTDNDVLKHRKAVQENILKAFGVDIEKSDTEEEIEKAHVEGEIHPNGKWYWKSSARGGKGDWRVIKKKGKKEKEEGGGSSKTTSSVGEDKKEVAKKELEKRDSKEKSKVEEKDIYNKIPNSVDDAIKNVKLDDETIEKLKKEAKQSINLKYASEDIDHNDTDIFLCKDRLERAIEKKDQKLISELSFNLLKSEFYSNEFKKELAKLKKEKSDFIKNSKYDFTDSQVEEYLKKYNNEKDPRAIVRNSWHTLMGHIGSTSATIRIGNGKEKPMKESSYPSWRPIGILNYKVRGWDGSAIEIKKSVQSWKEIEKNLDETENFSLYLYKHPKQ